MKRAGFHFSTKIINVSRDITKRKPCRPTVSDCMKFLDARHSGPVAEPTDGLSKCNEDTLRMTKKNLRKLFAPGVLNYIEGRSSTGQ